MNPDKCASVDRNNLRLRTLNLRSSCYFCRSLAQRKACFSALSAPFTSAAANPTANHLLTIALQSTSLRAVVGLDGYHFYFLFLSSTLSLALGSQTTVTFAAKAATPEIEEILITQFPNTGSSLTTYY
jgi:hypothetical protein